MPRAAGRTGRRTGRRSAARQAWQRTRVGSKVTPLRLSTPLEAPALSLCGRLGLLCSWFFCPSPCWTCLSFSVVCLVLSLLLSFCPSCLYVSSSFLFPLRAQVRFLPGRPSFLSCPLALVSRPLPSLSVRAPFVRTCFSLRLFVPCRGASLKERACRPPRPSSGQLPCLRNRRRFFEPHPVGGGSKNRHPPPSEKTVLFGHGGPEPPRRPPFALSERNLPPHTKSATGSLRPR